MSARMLAVLVALLVLVGGGAVYLFQKEQRTTTVEALGKPLLPGLKAAEVASIAIRAGDGSLNLVRKGNVWTLAERGDFPADAAKVRDFVVKILELRIGQSEPLVAADRARLQLAARDREGAATEVQFKGEDGKVLGTLLVGKKYFKGRHPDNADRAAGDGRFVMLPASPERVFIVSDPLAQATAKSAAWILTEGIAITDPASLEMRFRDGERWRIYKEPKKENAEWKLDPLKAGEKAEQSKLSSAAYGLYELKLADVAPPGLKPEDAGLDKPVTLGATDIEGIRYTLKLGKPREADATLYANIGVEGAIRLRPRQAPKDEKPGDPNKAKWDKEWAERQAKQQATLERQKQLANYTVLLQLKSLNDVLKRREELLDRKDEKKAKK